MHYRVTNYYRNITKKTNKNNLKWVYFNGEWEKEQKIYIMEKYNKK